MKKKRQEEPAIPGEALVGASLRQEHNLRLLASQYRRERLQARAGKDAAATIAVIKKFIPEIQKLTANMDPPVSPLIAICPPWPPGPPGYEKYRGLPILPPHVLGLELEPRSVTICSVNEAFTIENAFFGVFLADPAGECAWAQERPGKAAKARACAGVSFPSPVASVSFGYVSQFAIPESSEDTILEIASVINALFSWVEANPVEEGYARVIATSRCQVICMNQSGTGRLFEAPPRVLVDFVAQNETLFEQGYFASGGHAMNLKVPKEFAKYAYLYEIVDLVADAPGEHAYIEGTFTWSPLKISMKAGCRTIVLQVQNPYRLTKR